MKIDELVAGLSDAGYYLNDIKAEEVETKADGDLTYMINTIDEAMHFLEDIQKKYKIKDTLEAVK